MTRRPTAWRRPAPLGAVAAPARAARPGVRLLRRDEVAWLLTDLSGVALEAPTEEREEAIQSAAAHYAESLPIEYQPTAEYQRPVRRRRSRRPPSGSRTRSASSPSWSSRARVGAADARLARPGRARRSAS